MGTVISSLFKYTSIVKMYKCVYNQTETSHIFAKKSDNFRSVFAIELPNVVNDSDISKIKDNILVPESNSNESAFNNQEIALTHKFFKEIASKMPNIDEIHITGTGQIQEQFIKFLADTAQYKNAISTESTSNKMSDEKLLEFINSKFN